MLLIPARQTAQRKQPRHETDLGVRFARADELRHLVELHEVTVRLGCAFALRWHLDARWVDSAEGNEPV